MLLVLGLMCGDYEQDRQAHDGSSHHVNVVRDMCCEFVIKTHSNALICEAKLTATNINVIKQAQAIKQDKEEEYKE